MCPFLYRFFLVPNSLKLRNLRMQIIFIFFEKTELKIANNPKIRGECGMKDSE